MDIATWILHRFEPETAHRLSLDGLKCGSVLRLWHTQDDEPILKQTLNFKSGPLRFANPVGLAAGFDKNAEVPLAMLGQGFGFVECGTVTPLPQAGNPQPRLFRLSADKAVINRMGFNNDGLEVFSKHLEQAPKGLRPFGLIGANIGANKDSTDRVADYQTGLRRLWGLSDYFTLNISSPNTVGLRGLQEKDALETLLMRVSETRQALTRDSGRAIPVFLKIAPDLDSDAIAGIVEMALKYDIDALILTNTTLARPETLRSDMASETGGLSGQPLFPMALQAVKSAYTASQGRLPLIGAGGISSPDQAYAMIKAGASLIQLYSALVYEGLGLVAAIKRGLVLRLKADGFSTMAEAVGASAKG